MDILIKGMVMPIGCGWRTEHAYSFAKCPFYERCLEKGIRLTRESRPKVCPLVAVPSHGRLIDADALQAELEKHSHPSERGWYYAEVGQFIDEAETVLEAST